MLDICDLILDDHEVFRRRFGELDELHRTDGAPERSASPWGTLADLLEVLEREELGLRWLRFQADHACQRGIDTSDEDVDRNR